MTCKKCGAELSENTIFCTECGYRIGEEIIESNIKQNATNVSKENIMKYSFRLDKLVSKYGENNILKFTIYAGLAFFLSIRLMGFLPTAILLTIANSYLIFSKYRNNKKFDMKILLCSVLVLCVGIICAII